MAAITNVKLKPLRSSLPYQIVLYLNGWYLVIFLLAELGLLIWKGVILPYPSASLACDFVLVFLIVFTGALQIRSETKVNHHEQGKQGNLTQRVTSSVISFLLLAPVFVGALYFLLWQTYVFYFDVVIVAIEMAFVAFELILGLVSIITFARAPS